MGLRPPSFRPQRPPTSPWGLRPPWRQAPRLPRNGFKERNHPHPLPASVCAVFALIQPATHRIAMLRPRPSRFALASSLTNRQHQPMQLSVQKPGSSRNQNPNTQPTGTQFNTITGDDWKRSLTSARKRRIACDNQLKDFLSSQAPKMGSTTETPARPPPLHPQISLKL